MRDVKEGYGVMLSIGGCKYEGTWHEGAQEGYGIEVYKDGSKYCLIILKLTNLFTHFN